MSKISKQILHDILTAAKYDKIPLEQIIPAPYNPRVDLAQDDPDYKRIKQSILNHGFIQPIVYNKNTGNAVGGNQRLKILKELGIKEAVCAVIDVPLLQEMEISVALNKHGNLWDREKLRDIMIQFRDDGYDATKTAFDPDEIARLTEEMNISVSDFFEDQQDEPKQKTVHTYKCPHCGEVFTK